jgi:hypothetical protein
MKRGVCNKDGWSRLDDKVNNNKPFQSVPALNHFEQSLSDCAANLSDAISSENGHASKCTSGKESCLLL